MAPVNTRAKKLASFDEKPIKGMRPVPVFDFSLPKGTSALLTSLYSDHDPEAEGDVSTEDGSDSEVEQADAAATEHYVSVGYVLLLSRSLSLARLHNVRILSDFVPSARASSARKKPLP